MTMGAMIQEDKAQYFEAKWQEVKQAELDLLIEMKKEHMLSDDGMAQLKAILSGEAA